jgi:hypothetical protein
MISAFLQAPTKELEQWPKIIEQASKSPLGIVALMLLLLSILALVFFRKANATIRLVVFLVMFGSLVMYGFAITRTANQVYRVRVIVLGADRSPLENARVWSSFGGEPMKVAGGWLFVIPPQTRPAGGELTIYAEVKEAFLSGNQTLKLADEMNPNVTLQLVNIRQAKVRGIVEDQNRSAISGAEISVVGYDSERVLTGSTGSFELPAHAATDQQVQVHAEKKGYRATNAWCPAGDTPCELVLRRAQGASGRH